jgi:SPP1 family predicted phage head-tail adaptor
MPLIHDPSQLNERITFNKKQTVKVNGISTANNVVIASVWAAVIIQRLSDRMANIGNEVANITTFVIREKQDFEIDNKMTVSWGNTTYQIKDIDPDPVNHEWKTIICEVISS